MNRLFFDIEVSPNVVMSWRLGRKVNIDANNLLKERAIICIGYKWEKEKKAQVIEWDHQQDDRQMLIEFIDIAAEADELVGHNGDKFDMPWIKTRCIFHGIPTFPSYKTIDTLAWARKRFYFNSNRLDYLGKYLGIGGKIKTDFDLWKSVVLSNDRKALKRMTDYCKRDVEMLQQVYERMAPHMPHKTHAGVLAGRDKWTSPFTGKTDVYVGKRRVSAAGAIVYQMQCAKTGRYFTISESAYRDYQEWKLSKASD